MEFLSPLVGDHLKEAERARRLAAAIDDSVAAEALLRYAIEQEIEWQRERIHSATLNSGPVVI